MGLPQHPSSKSGLWAIIIPFPIASFKGPRFSHLLHIHRRPLVPRLRPQALLVGGKAELESDRKVQCVRRGIEGEREQVEAPGSFALGWCPH